MAIASQGEPHESGPLDLAHALEFAIALVEAPRFDPVEPPREILELAEHLQIVTPLVDLTRLIPADEGTGAP